MMLITQLVIGPDRIQARYVVGEVAEGELSVSCASIAFDAPGVRVTFDDGGWTWFPMERVRQVKGDAE